MLSLAQQACHYETQCGFLNQCIASAQNPSQFFCVHNGLFPITLYTAIVYTIIPPLLGIGMLGGLGGGVLKGPILEMLLDYNQQEATMISYAIMFGGCLLNTVIIPTISVYDFLIRHPIFTYRPAVNYNLAMIFNCSIALGTNLGTMLSVFLPQFVVTLIQEIFLAGVIPYLWYKAQKQRRVDQLRSTVVEDNESVRDRLLSQSLCFVNRETTEYEILVYDNFRKQQASLLPRIQCLVIFAFFLVAQIVMNVLNVFAPLFYLPKCFKFSYILIFLLLCINPIMTYGVYQYGKKVFKFYNNWKQELLKDMVGFDIVERLFAPKIFMMIYFSGFFSGFFSGLLGLGAGLVMVPMMLHIGIHPRVASATSAFNYFWISLNNIIKLLIDQSLPRNIVLWYIFLSAVGGSVFTKIGYVVIDKYKISSLVIFIVFALALLNFIAGIYYVTVESTRFGFQSQLEFAFECK